MKGYSIACDGKSIKCLECGMTSYNLIDVEEKYCSNCNIFHCTSQIDIDREEELWNSKEKR